MSVQQTARWGLTPPLSVKPPTDAELRTNDAVIEELKRQNNYEGSEETERRKSALQAIQKYTVEFVKVASKEHGLPPAVVNSAGGKIFTYGSYRLGVYGPGSDIDTLVVAPKHVTREDFFKHFPQILERMAPPGAVEEMTPVPDAYVPIIKLEYSGISIDLIFARLALPSIPLNLDLRDDSLLKGLDEQEIRSVNGTRVTDEILALVPHQKTFRTALRAVKLWAQRRAMYANIMGFPGGVAWAMLVARVCQLYPAATGSVIVSKFFNIISTWQWPTPIQLKAPEKGPVNGMNHRVWNPQVYRGDSFHLMPIITPAYPSMCATHNITASTLNVIMAEVNRAKGLMGQIFAGQLAWKDLFQRHSFFTEGYKYYLSVVASSRTKEAQSLWSGFVESKVRLLVTDLEQSPSVELAHPFNKGFERVHKCGGEEEIAAVISGDLKYQIKEIKTETTDKTNDPTHRAAAQGEADAIPVPQPAEDLTTNGDEVHQIYTTTYYVGIQLEKGQCFSYAFKGNAERPIDAAKTLDISYQTKKFKSLCLSWPSYDENLNSLVIVHTRNYDLPNDVFESADTRPTRPKKKSKKRNFDATELQAGSPIQCPTA